MKGRRAGGAVMVVVVGLATAACSGTTGSASPDAGITRVATFRAVGADVSRRQLTADAHTLTVRLRSFGDTHASVTVQGRSVVVSGPPLPVSAAVLLEPGVFQIRPALCQADPYKAPASGPGPGVVPTACSSSRYSVQAPTLTVNTSSGSSNFGNIMPDPMLTSYPSSTAGYDDSHPDNSVLVPELRDDGVRFLLGPAVLDDTAVASASATHENPEWIVDVTFTPAGATAWNAVAQAYFHEFIGIDIDGQAVSVPITQPTQSTFTSFGNRAQISGNFTKQLAEQFAAILESGPLTTPLSG